MGLGFLWGLGFRVEGLGVFFGGFWLDRVAYGL